VPFFLDLAFADEPPPDAPHLTFAGMTPVLDIGFEGKQIPFTFDTGAQDSTLNPVFAQNFPDIVKPGVEKDYTDLGFGGDRGALSWMEKAQPFNRFPCCSKKQQARASGQPVTSL